MYISKCEACMEECPQAQGRHEAAVGRMYAMRELAKCAPYWDSLFDENEEPKITPGRLRELVEADREGRCVVLPCKVGDTVYQVDDIRVYALEVRNLIYDAGILAFDESTIGKTVFLTRAEAEAALRREQDG